MRWHVSGTHSDHSLHAILKVLLVAKHEHPGVLRARPHGRSILPQLFLLRQGLGQHPEKRSTTVHEPKAIGGSGRSLKGRQAVEGQQKAVEGQRQAVEGQRQAVECQRWTVNGQRKAVQAQREAVEGQRHAVCNGSKCIPIRTGMIYADHH